MSEKALIKVCGMREVDNIQALLGLKPDFIGFIFYPPSMRYVSVLEDHDLDYGDTKKIGVFVNESKEAIEEKIQRFRLDGIQLHGRESPEFCRYFKDKVLVFKAFGIEVDLPENIKDYEGVVDLLVLDTKTPDHGGSGRTFNWQVLDDYSLNTPFLLSGGLSLEMVDEIKAFEHPRCQGVDLNSRFETSPGVKSIKQLTSLFKALRNE